MIGVDLVVTHPKIPGDLEERKKEERTKGMCDYDRYSLGLLNVTNTCTFVLVPTYERS